MKSNAERLESLYPVIQKVTEKMVRQYGEYVGPNRKITEEDMFQHLCLMVLQKQTLSSDHFNSFTILFKEAKNYLVDERNSSGLGVEGNPGDSGMYFTRDQLRGWLAGDWDQLPSQIAIALKDSRLPEQYRADIESRWRDGIVPRGPHKEEKRLADAMKRLLHLVNLPVNSASKAETREVPFHLLTPAEQQGLKPDFE